MDTWHGLREPDGRVPAQRADFEDVLGAQELAEEGEVLALGGGDGYGWEGLVLAVGFGGGEAGVGGEELGLGLLGAGYGLGEDGGEGGVGRHCCGGGEWVKKDDHARLRPRLYIWLREDQMPLSHAIRANADVRTDGVT